MYFSGDCRDLAHGHLMDSDDRGMHSGGVPHRRSSRGVLSGASVGSFWSVATVVLVAIAVCLLIGIWYVGEMKGCLLIGIRVLMADRRFGISR